jgi:Zn-dependent protease
MIVIPGRIPVAIHPFFWLLAAMIGWAYSQNLMGTFIWVGIIFFSVLIHEFGHALTAVMFRQKAQIQLVALGGLTSYEGPKLRFWQQFLITFNGPLFGFFLFLFATFMLQMKISVNPVVIGILKWTQVANFFWTIVNLLPVLPLDGGQLLRIVLEAIFGIKGFRAALLIGAIIASLFSFYFFIAQAFLAGALFFLFAFQSFDSWRKSRFVRLSDRDEENKALLHAGEAALKEGKKEEARHLFEQVRTKSAGGVLSFAAAQYLAFLSEQEGNHKLAYDLLKPIREHLSEDALCLLHKLAAVQKDYQLVADISSDCYQIANNLETAIRNARAFAYLKQPKPAGGWLQAAWRQGGLDLEMILQEEEFLAIKDDPEFRSFVERLKP